MRCDACAHDGTTEGRKPGGSVMFCTAELPADVHGAFRQGVVRAAAGIQPTVVPPRPYKRSGCSDAQTLLRVQILLQK